MEPIPVMLLLLKLVVNGSRLYPLLLLLFPFCFVFFTPEGI